MPPPHWSGRDFLLSFTTTLAVSLAVAELLYTRRSRICFVMALNPPPRVGVNSHYQKKRVRKWSDTVWECCRSGVGMQPCWVDLRWPPPSSLPINHSANYSSNYVITMPLKHIQHKLRKVKGNMEIRPENTHSFKLRSSSSASTETVFFTLLFCHFGTILLEHPMSTMATESMQ